MSEPTNQDEKIGADEPSRRRCEGPQRRLRGRLRPPAETVPV